MKKINKFYVYRDNGNDNYDNLLVDVFFIRGEDLFKIWRAIREKPNLQRRFGFNFTKPQFF